MYWDHILKEFDVNIFSLWWNKKEIICMEVELIKSGPQHIALLRYAVSAPNIGMISLHQVESWLEHCISETYYMPS